MKTLYFSLFFICCLFSIQAQNSSIADTNIVGRFISPDGRELARIKVPGKPPDNFRMPASNPTTTSVIIPDVPGYDWSFGCSPTSAAMMAGYYDRSGYPNIYTGPTNGGVAPMDNSSWGSVVINGETRKQCPISATRNGVDGRTSRGHVDDYWVVYNSMSPDPYITNGWTQHTYGDCTADFMYSNQYVYQTVDGGTSFIVDPNGLPVSVQAGWGYSDGLYGLTQFYVSRGYAVDRYYTQYLYGYSGNTLGFNFTQFKQEINAGRPVLIQLTGHTMIGFGYDEATTTIYLHDTWDYSMHSMTWGGTYGGMSQWGVCVLQLSGSPNIIPTVSTTALTCNGTITSTAGGIAYDGGDTITVRGLCWGTSHDPTVAGSKSIETGGEGSFSSTMSGLTPNTTYYVRAYATNTLGTGYGLEITFITQAANVMSNVTTTSISNINSTFATSGGTVTCDGGSAVTSRGVCWNTSTAPTTSNDKTVNGSGMGVFTSNITGLAGGTTYFARAYATSSAGTSYGNELSFSTISTASCSPLTINHQAGNVAPVNKTVTYGTVANIPGAPLRCWITSNLGSDHQATAVDDTTEASAGWYWQFNRKQGYKHNGSSRTPNTAWITSINESLDWEASNDPCNIELGCGWRVPTDSEWNNVDASGNWNNWDGPWNSPLKMHAAGMLEMGNGALSYRGVKGIYWSSKQQNATAGWILMFTSTSSYISSYPKTAGFPLRCIKNTDGTTTTPTVTSSLIINITQNTATSGGNVTSDGGCPVTTRGVCWSTSAGPTTSNSSLISGSGTGIFTANLTGLISNTLYYLRAFATNSNGTVYGNEISFVTFPSITTEAITGITQTTASTGGTIAVGGGATVTSRGVCWSTTIDPVVTGSHTLNGIGAGGFLSNITGLTAATLYYVRAYAVNGGGTAYGEQLSFMTSSPIQLISPNGGETWISGTNHTIIWNATNVVNVTIAYSTDNGANWTTIIPSTPATSGSYSWNVPNPNPNVISVTCKVKVTSTANTNAFDISDAAFTILNALKHAPVTYTDTIPAADNTSISVPVKVDKFRKITALSLRLDYNPSVLTYLGSANINGALSGLIVNNTSVSSTLSKVIISWSDLTPATLSDGSKLADLLFTHITGATGLTWNNTENSGQDCAYADSIGNPLTDIPTALFYTDGEVHTLTGWPLNGMFVYNNTANTPLDSLWIILRQNDIRIDSTQTTLSGAYSFTGKADGTYTLSARTNKAWSSVNATDAIKVQRHFAGLELLTEPVRLNAADVNLSNSINATDAIKIKRRFSGLDNSFMRGDWTFSKQVLGGDTIIINGAALIQNFYGLCVGDVNGSNVPAPGDWIDRKIEFTSEGTIEVTPGKVFELPVKARNDINVSAISLVIPYPEDLIEVQDVQISNGAPVFNLLPGQLRIAWSELQTINLKAGETLLTLKLRAKEDFSGDRTIELSPGMESELADELGETISLAELSSLTIKPLKQNGINDYGELISSCKVYPNPAKDYVTLEFQLNSAAEGSMKMLDIVGREIKAIPMQRFEKGNSRLVIQTKELLAGLYTLKLSFTFNGKQKDYLQKVIVSR